MRKVLALAALALLALAVGCGSGRKASKDSTQNEPVRVQCPYCKSVFRW